MQRNVKLKDKGVTSRAGKLNLPKHLSSSPVLVGFMLLDLWFYMYVLQIVVCPFVLFLSAIVLSVLLRYTDSDYLPLISSYSSTFLFFKLLHEVRKYQITFKFNYKTCSKMKSNDIN